MKIYVFGKKILFLIFVIVCSIELPAQEFVWKNIYSNGSYDKQGKVMYGIQMMYLVPHKGILFAANGTQGETNISLYPKAAQLLALDSANGRWRVDHQFTTNNPRVSFLGSFKFENDRNGFEINPTVTILLAAPSETSKRFITWVRDDASGQWRATDTLHIPGAPSNVQPRAMTLYRDAVTGRQNLYVGIEGGGVYSGGYESTQPTRISWDTTPEFVPPFSWQRVLGFASANGRLYCALSSSGDGQFSDVKDSVAHVYERTDGQQPSWHRIYTTEPGLTWEDIRGLTAVPDPAAPGKQLLIFTWNDRIYTIDPQSPPADGKATVEFDMRQGISAQTGLPVIKVVAAYNRFVPFHMPSSLDTVWLAGLAVLVHQKTTTTPNLNGWTADGLYLVRSRLPGGGVGYKVRYILKNDPGAVTDTLLAVRDFAVSPFSEDRGEVLYACGLDHQAMPMSLAAWIYRGVLINATSIIDKKDKLPSDFMLLQNYPNPFNPSTVISYQISEASHVTLKVFDLLGREVATLVDEFKQAGLFNSQFIIQNSKFTSGVYFYQLKAGKYSETKKMVVIR